MGTYRPGLGFCSTFFFIGQALLSFNALAPDAVADDVVVNCQPQFAETPLETTTASGTIWAHVLRRENSAKRQAERLLSGALSGIHEATPPAEACPTGCYPLRVPQIVLRSAPSKLRTSYPDQSYCRGLQQQTERSPMVFEERLFSDLEELLSWFSDFTQGDGLDGEELYAKCARECTPRYEVTIRLLDSGLSGGATAICGEARDKDDGNFELDTRYRFTCGAS